MDNEEADDHPDRVEALVGNLSELRSQFADFGRAQAKQTQSLDILNGKFNSLEYANGDLQMRMMSLEGGLKGLRNEVSGKFDRLENTVTDLKNEVGGVKGDFAWLRSHFTDDDGLLVAHSRDLQRLADDVTEVKADVTVLRDNVTVLEVKVDKLEGKVDDLQADVRELKTDMTEVKGSLREILERLPLRAA